MFRRLVLLATATAMLGGCSFGDNSDKDKGSTPANLEATSPEEPTTPLPPESTTTLQDPPADPVDPAPDNSQLIAELQSKIAELETKGTDTAQLQAQLDALLNQVQGSPTNGKLVLVPEEGDLISAGEVFYTINPNGKIDYRGAVTFKLFDLQLFSVTRKFQGSYTAKPKTVQSASYKKEGDAVEEFKLEFTTTTVDGTSSTLDLSVKTPDGADSKNADGNIVIDTSHDAIRIKEVNLEGYLEHYLVSVKLKMVEEQVAPAISAVEPALPNDQKLTGLHKTTQWWSPGTRITVAHPDLGPDSQVYYAGHPCEFIAASWRPSEWMFSCDEIATKKTLSYSLVLKKGEGFQLLGIVPAKDHTY